MARNRIIYQSEALYVGPIGGGQASDHNELHRVQDISHDMSVTRTDIFEFGRLAALDRVMIEPPSVTLDFSYLLTDGGNENNLGLQVAGRTAGGGSVPSSAWNLGTYPNMISGIMANRSTDPDEKNYYVVTAPEGKDAHGDNSNADWFSSHYISHSVVGFGNGVLSNYSVNGAVGDFPSASVSVEAYNVSFISGKKSNDAGSWISGNALPSINKGNNSIRDGDFELPNSTTGVGTLNVFALRPGDIVFDFNATSAGAIDTTSENPIAIGGAVLPTGNAKDPDNITDAATQGEPVHIQSFSIDAPLSRTPLTRLGSTFPYARPIDFPQSCTMNVSAYLADVTTGSLVDLLCSDNSRNIAVNLKVPCSQTDGAPDGSNTELTYLVKNAKLTSQNFAATIGDTKTVDLVFEAQWGGSNDSTNGIFISGTAKNAVK